MICDFNFVAVFLRKTKNGKPEIVLLDHGLYEKLPSSVRLSLCQFWESIVLKDQAKMDRYAHELNVYGQSIFFVMQEIDI